jgi:hypothetical protein
VRLAASKLVGTFEPATVLRPEVEFEIEKNLGNDDPLVRLAAVKVLGRLEPLALTRHSDAFVNLLNDHVERHPLVIAAAIASLKRCDRFCIRACKRTRGSLVGCDQCMKWFHCQCVGLLVQSAKAQISYHCDQCASTGLTTAIRLQSREGDAGNSSDGPRQTHALLQRAPRYSRRAERQKRGLVERKRVISDVTGTSSAASSSGSATPAAAPTVPTVTSQRPKTESVASDDGHVSEEDTPTQESVAARVRKKGTAFPGDKYLVAPEHEQSLTQKGGQGEILLVYDGGGSCFAAKFPRPTARSTGRFTNRDQLMREIECACAEAERDHRRGGAVCDHRRVALCVTIGGWRCARSLTCRVVACAGSRAVRLPVQAVGAAGGPPERCEPCRRAL